MANITGRDNERNRYYLLDTPYPPVLAILTNDHHEPGIHVCVIHLVYDKHQINGDDTHTQQNRRDFVSTAKKDQLNHILRHHHHY